jgi:hypothetical protein
LTLSTLERINVPISNEIRAGFDIFYDCKKVYFSV